VEKRNSITIYRYKMSRKDYMAAILRGKLLFSLREYGFGLMEKLPLAYQACMLDSIMKNHEDIELISAYHSLTRGFVATLVKGKYEIPVVVTIFGEIYSAPDYYLKRRKAIQFVVNRADSVLSVSQHCARSLERIGLDYSKIRVIPYGIDTKSYSPALDKAKIRQRFNIQGESKVVLFVGRLIEDTGLSTVLEMIPLLLRERSDVNIVLAGAKGDLTQKAMEVADRSEGKVSLAVDVPSQELPYYYASCDVLLATATDDRACMGMTIKEAMASGKPVIAANVGGVPEAIRDGETGFLVKPNDPVELARVVTKVLSRPGSTEQIAAKARLRAEDLFDKNRTNERILSVFEKAMLATNQR